MSTENGDGGSKSTTNQGGSDKIEIKKVRKGPVNKPSKKKKNPKSKKIQ